MLTHFSRDWGASALAFLSSVGRRRKAAGQHSHRNYSEHRRGGGGSDLVGVSSVEVAGPKESCDVTIVYNGKLKWLESCLPCVTLSYSSKIKGYFYHQRVSPPLKKMP
jgi:hypothetical protein